MSTKAPYVRPEIAFRFANLTHSRMNYADLMGAEFSDCRLQYALFDGSNLEESSFSNCELFEASFVGANLMGAEFEGSNVSGADFTRANLEGATGLPTDARRAKLLRLKVANLIESTPDLHDQSNWGGKCGTPCCVAGWAVRLAADNDLCMSIPSAATLILHLDGAPMPSFYSSARPADIIRDLRNITDKGES